MPLLLTVIVGLTFCMEGCGWPSRDHVRARIENVLGQLPSMLASDPSGLSAQVFANREGLPLDTIQPYFYGIRGALHENPPGRQARIEEVEGWLAPFEPVLVAVLEASSRSNEAPNAVATILEFTRPTPTLRTALLRIARDPKTDTQKASEAYETLFMLELDDAEVRQEVVAKIAWRDDLLSRAELGMTLLVSGSSRWGLVELEPLYREFLSVPFKPTNYPPRGGRVKLEHQYDVAIRGLKAFGTRAAPFADLLKARLAEMDPAQDADLINSCKETIMMVEGKCNPMPVVSWKGAFLGVSRQAYPEWVARQKPPAADASKSGSLAPPKTPSN